VANVRRHLAARTSRAFPIRAYFVALFVLVVVGAGAGAIYVDREVARDAREQAERDALHSARTAAEQLGDHLDLLRQTPASLAANPQMGQLLKTPEGCTLTFQGIGGPDRGHLDIMRADGSIACSSKPDAEGRTSYAGAAWLPRALREPLFIAPEQDVAGVPVAIASSPITGGLGAVVAFADLSGLARTLAELYGGGRPSIFTITSADDRTVVSRSVDPDRWIGTKLEPGGFSHEAGAEMEDLEGVSRLFAHAQAPGTGWHVYVGESTSEVLRPAERLRNNLLGLVGASLAMLLLFGAFAYRKVVTPIQRLSGSVRAASGVEAPAPIDASGPAEVRGLAEDVNSLTASVHAELAERRRAEQAAQSSEESYRLLFESNPSPMWLYDAESLRFLAVNDAAVEVYGWSREEFLGMTIADIRAPDEVERLHELLERQDPGGLHHAGVWRHRRKDGTELDVEIHSHDHMFEGRHARVVLSLDVSERVELEEQLRQAQRLESIGRLAGGVAHDFNNLLTVISGYAEVLLEREEGKSTELTQIAAAAERATILTRQLLAFSRRQILLPRVIELNDVVEGLTAMLTRLIGEDIELEATLAPDLDSVLADPSQLEQVLVNLVVNARDAMPEGGKLTIQTANVELDEDYVSHHGEVTVGPHVMLSVTDIGTGMDPETAAHVFEPFFTTKPVGTGTGLGLATVYGIVKQSGGSIWVYSEPGRGTTFKIYLPRAESTAADEAAPESRAAANGSETILLAEDDPALRELTAFMLEQRGFEVISATTAREALRLAEEHPIEIALLLTDLIMPELSGRALAEKVRALRPGIRVLFISGYADDAVRRTGSLEADAAFLEKPFSANDLATKVRETLDAAA
jgi:two-component system cell cycle sensor histidine kinase/response regulator CckA